VFAGTVPDGVQSTVINPKKTVKKNLFLKEESTKAEVLWCLRTVVSHISFRSAGECVTMMKLMFADSEIAESIQRQRTKVAYSIVHGIAPFF